MKKDDVGRREFLGRLVGSAAALTVASATSPLVAHARPRQERPTLASNRAPRIKFGVIGLNHGHIYGQTTAVLRGGGGLVSVFAREPDLAAAFVKRFPQAKLARSEQEILEDPNIQLVLSA
ncbi:MAG TPA: hypothetical protein VNJ03_13865, partial [Vicinamibacterales bacterium]|nr:hypothetical protein [Vicinamibacterales bacterium]